MENDARYSQACAWAQSQLAAGADVEALVAALMGQGWQEYPARQVLDAALTSPGPVAAPRRVQPVMQYATPGRAAPRAKATAGGSHHGRNMLIGGAVCALGIAITVGTYSSASSSGGTYTVCWGAMLFGFVRFISGLFGYLGGG